MHTCLPFSLHKMLPVHVNFKTLYTFISFFGNTQTEIKVDVQNLLQFDVFKCSAALCVCCCEVPFSYHH